MSDKVQTWNTQAINEFKSAFDQQKNTVLKFAKDSLKLLEQAAKMLGRRSDLGFETYMGVTGHEATNGRKVTQDLFKLCGELKEKTDQKLTEAENCDKNAWASTIDKLTEQLTNLTDEWIAFETLAISSRNLMIANPDDEKLRSALINRITRQLEVADHLTKAKVKGIAPIDKALRELLDQVMAPKERDFLAFSRQLDQLQQKIASLATAEAPKGGDPKEYYKPLLKFLYNIEIREDKVTEQETSYDNLFKAFAMLPPDHARNAALSVVEFGDIKDAGGYYSESKKLIRIQANISDRGIKEYTNPDTGKVEKLNGFALTTLHEVGHSIDAAYGLMDKHKADDGCGHWVSVDPMVFLQTGFGKAKPILIKAVCDFVETIVPQRKCPNITEKELVDGYRSYFYGKSLNDAFKGPVKRLLETQLNALVDVVNGKLKPAIDKLDQQMKAALTNTDNLDKPVAELWNDLENLADAVEKSVAADWPNTVTKDEIKKKFIVLFSGSDTLKDPPPKPAPVSDWLDDERRLLMSNIVMATMGAEDSAAKWADNPVVTLDAPADLNAYKSKAEPWSKDLTGQQINGVDAAHQAYDSDTLWWRYAGRSKTLVSDYQWRAPGEWFAEVYAWTWFKKVDPPPAVAKALRPYLFGGSISI